MDKDRNAGSIRSLSEPSSKLSARVLGDRKTKAEGKAQGAEGRFQNVIGGLKDVFRGFASRR
jgi:hypothetical protein